MNHDLIYDWHLNPQMRWWHHRTNLNEQNITRKILMYAVVVGVVLLVPLTNARYPHHPSTSVTTLNMLSRAIVLAIAACTLQSPMVAAWVPQQLSSVPSSSGTGAFTTNTRSRTALASIDTKGDDKKVETEEVEDTTQKFGLEAGLFESMKKKDGGESAKSLLKKYGIAYLATSIPLALVSFSICYFLVDSGVDVSALLGKVGIDNAASEKAGTFAIAYAAHKAASPIRFPPTVILTPLVAKLIGKEAVEVTEDADDEA